MMACRVVQVSSAAVTSVAPTVSTVTSRINRVVNFMEQPVSAADASVPRCGEPRRTLRLGAEETACRDEGTIVVAAPTCQQHVGAVFATRAGSAGLRF